MTFIIIGLLELLFALVVHWRYNRSKGAFDSTILYTTPAQREVLRQHDRQVLTLNVARIVSFNIGGCFVFIGLFILGGMPL